MLQIYKPGKVIAELKCPVIQSTWERVEAYMVIGWMCSSIREYTLNTVIYIYLNNLLGEYGKYVSNYCDIFIFFGIYRRESMTFCTFLFK